MLQTPVLFLVFNRPDTTRQVFEQIRAVRPKQLFVSADGPRGDRVGEKEKCELVRSLILNNIDWDCEVKTLFRDRNLGCGKAVSEGITWFFDQVEMGIVLEDDTLPGPSFFSFCEEMLKRYANDNRVTSISGTNLMASANLISDSYSFSYYPGIWGWASWRRAWNGYDIQIKKWSMLSTKIKFLIQFGVRRFLFFDAIFDPFHEKNGVDTWDYQWWFHQLDHGFGIMPAKNLVRNIGFNADATHTGEINKDLILEVQQLELPLKHPEAIRIDKGFDIPMYTKFYLGENLSFISNLKRTIRALLR